jgi:asparagine synthase (glutamine-hydrolysing)
MILQVHCMGGLFFCILNDPSLINVSLTKSFMKLQSRGQGYSQYFIDHTLDLDLPENKMYKSRLNKSDSLSYKKLYFVYGFHRSILNDTSLNGAQPFQDPIPHVIHLYPELRKRPLRKLLCNGEIYNYQSLISENLFTDKDLSSGSDTEVILPLFIKYGISETLSKLKGEYSFILTENTGTCVLSEVRVYAARDQLGIKPLYYIDGNLSGSGEGFSKFFFSEKCCIPECFKGYTVHEFPIGSYWSYYTNTFVKFHDFNVYNTVPYVITTASSEHLELVYNTVPVLLESSVSLRLHESIGIFVSDGFDSCILLSILCKLGLSTVNVFSFGESTGNSCITYLQGIYPDITFNHYSVSENLHLSTEVIDEIECKTSLSPNESGFSKAIGIYSLMNIVKKQGVKVILCGEGLSSLFPDTSVDTFQSDCIGKLNNLHKNSLLLWDRMAGMFDIETRFPWLDLDLIDFIMKISPHLRLPQLWSGQRVSKYIVRKSFDNPIYLDANTLYSTNSPFTTLYSTYS